MYPVAAVTDPETDVPASTIAFWFAHTSPVMVSPFFVSRVVYENSAFLKTDGGAIVTWSARVAAPCFPGRTDPTDRIVYWFRVWRLTVTEYDPCAVEPVKVPL